MAVVDSVPVDKAHRLVHKLDLVYMRVQADKASALASASASAQVVDHLQVDRADEALDKAEFVLVASSDRLVVADSPAVEAHIAALAWNSPVDHCYALADRCSPSCQHLESPPRCRTHCTLCRASMC